MSETKKTALPVSVPAEMPGGAEMVKAITDLRCSAGPMRYCSLVPITDAQRHLYLSALEGEGVSYAEAVNIELAVTDVAITRRQLADPETAEIYDSVVTVVFTADGKHFGGTSVPVRNALIALMQLFGAPPWHPPLVLRVRARDRGENRRMYFLDFVRRDAKGGAK